MVRQVAIESSWRTRSSPWNYNRNTGRGAAENHYDAMTVSQLIDMRACVTQLSAPDCALFLWATFPTIHTHALPVMEHWGFTYKTAAFIWVKVSRRTGKPVIGGGQYTRANAEPCLIGIRGKPERLDFGVPQIILAPRSKHSVKPAQQYGRIQRLYKGPYLELFARRHVGGWDVDGMEINGSDYTDEHERVSLPPA